MDTRHRLELAVQHHHTGEPEKACDLLKQLLDEEPRQVDALNLLGATLCELGESEQGIEYLRKAATLAGGNADVQSNLGTALYLANHVEEAEKCFHRAINLKPDNADLHAFLGNTLRRLERHSEAVHSFQRSVTLGADNVDVYRGLGQSLFGLERHKAARDAFLNGIQIDPTDQLCQAYLGLVLTELNQGEEAEKYFKKAIKLRPNDAVACMHLAKALHDRDRFEQAMKYYKQAIQIQPRSAIAMTGLGYTLQSLGRLDEAIASCKQALTVNVNLSNAYSCMANCYGDQGNQKDSEENYAKAIATQPRPKVFATYYRLLSKAHKFQGDDPLIPEMQTLLSDEKLSDENRMHLHYALGHAFHSLKIYDKAFEQYSAGNAHSRKMFDFDIKHSIAVDRQTINLCTKEFLGREQRPVGSGSDRPVFVVGMPRSGTTLVEQIVACHPQGHGAGELQQLNSYVRRLSRLLKKPFPVLLKHVTQNNATDVANDYLRVLDELAPQGAVRIVDKAVLNFRWLGLIALIFPNAKVINCKRDPMDTCLSNFIRFFPAEGLGFSHSLTDLGIYYRGYERLMNHWNEVQPLPILTMQYEEMVANQEGKTRELLEFIGLPWNEKCLEFHKNTRSVRTASNLQVRKPIYTTSVGRWKNYEKHLEPLRKALDGEAE